MFVLRQALQLLLAASAAVAAAGQLRFTAIPDQQESSLLARADAVTAYLEEYIRATCGANVTVTYNPVADYDAAVDALLDGVADFGWYGGLTGVQAGLRSPPAVYLAQRVEDKQFTSVFIQPAGSESWLEGLFADPIALVHGKSLAFGSASSTSGHLMPAYYLAEAGVTPSSTIFTGSHDATIDAVIDGTTEVGALNSIVWDRRVAANTTNGTSVFYTTPEYADYLWVAGAGIVDTWAALSDASSAPGCEDINALLTEAFLSANATDPLAQALFDAYSTVGYVAITPGEYDPIEETGCQLEMIEKQYCDEPIPENLGNVGNGTALVEVPGPSPTPTAPPAEATGSPTASPTASPASGGTSTILGALSIAVFAVACICV